MPATAAHFVAASTEALADHLGTTAGVPARIGRVDADLTARIRLTDVQLGSLFAADSLEASVGLDSLLSGQLGADEIRVAAPRVAVEVDRGGDSDLARVVRRLAKSGGSRTGTTRLRRIVVSSGVLVAHVPGVGEVSAENVELVPDAGGVRVITGKLRLRGSVGRAEGELVLARASAEVALPHVKFGRVLAVAGSGSVSLPDLHGGASQTIPLRDVSIGRLVAGGSLELRAALDDGGMPRHLAAELAPAGADGSVALTLRGDHLPLRAFAPLVPHGVVLDDAHASGALTIRRTGPALAFTIDGTLEGARLDHALAGGAPIAFAPELHGTLAIAPDAITADHLSIGLGAEHWTASGIYHRSQPLRAELDVAIETAPCAALLASLPPEIRGPLDGMAMTGNFGGRAHLGLDLGLPAGEGVFLAVDLDNRCTVTAEPPAADPMTLAQASEQTFADGTRAKVGKGQPDFAELRTLPYFLPAAFVSAEDGRFYDHHGFDIAQIGKSFEIDLRDRKLARGGSTISQQLVKNSFLAQHRTLDRKLQEAILTWRLEARLAKKQILERYLNIIELGPHTFGVGAAARYWFGVPPQALDVRQAAFLAALTSEPKSMGRRVRHANGLDADSAARVEVILHAMFRAGWIDRTQLDHARDLPLHFSAAALKAD
ncbi:MAG: biosynthetic peptidoglycan transglycosylase [Deltaproteobacteria bacterium]